MDTQDITRHEDLDRIVDLVRNTEQAYLRGRFLTGTCSTVGVFCGALALFCGADLLFGFNVPFRMAAFLALIASAGYFLARSILVPLIKRPSLIRTAGRIEFLLPGMKNRLVSCVDLAGDVTSARSAPAFLDRLIRETTERVRDFKPAAIMDVRALRRSGALVLVALAALAAVLFAPPLRGVTSMARIFVPLADIPPASPYAWVLFPGSVQLLKGDDLMVRVHLSRGLPEKVRLEIRGEAARRPLRYDMESVSDGAWEFPLSGFEKDFNYRILVDDAWSRTHQVEIVDRPEIVSLQSRLHAPEYLAPAPPKIIELDESDITGPAGSLVEITVQTQGQVQTGSIQWVEASLIESDGKEPADQWKVLASYPMEKASPTDLLWSGNFSLESNGWYRVVVADNAGRVNRPMVPGRFLALPDEPPRITLERPGADLRISAPESIPIVIAASDDFALADVRLVFPRGSGEVEREQSVKTYTSPAIGDMVVTAINPAEIGLKIGDTLSYAAEVRDRKGWVARTETYTIHLTDDPDASDRRMGTFSEAQTLLTEKLGTLKASQQTIAASLQELKVQYAPVIERVEIAAADIREAPEEMEPVTNETAVIPVAAMLKLDPETTKQLEALQAEYGSLAGLQAANVEQALAIQAQLAEMIEKSGTLRLAPWGLARRLQALSETFDQAGLESMYWLATRLQQGADPLHPLPDLDRMLQLSGYLDRDLLAMYEDTQGIHSSARRYRTDPAEAMARLAQARLRSEASLASRGLRGLQDHLARMERQFETLRRQQEALRDEAAEAEGEFLDELLDEQAQLEVEMMDPLSILRQLLNEARDRNSGREPVFPAAPYAPDHGSYYVPPREQDTEGEKDDSADFDWWETASVESGEGDTEEEPNPYLPALGGPRAQLDPRFRERVRPTDRRMRGDRSSAQRRNDLRSRQWQRLRELETAGQSAGSDQQAVSDIVRDLWDARRGMWSWDRQQRQSAALSLHESLSSPSVRDAGSMAERLQDIMNERRGDEDEGDGRSYAAAWAAMLSGQGSRATGEGRVRLGYSGLPAELDPAARTVLLGMQPKLREELLSGMRERGPEAYRLFIEEYFRQLTRWGEAQTE